MKTTLSIVLLLTFISLTPNHGRAAEVSMEFEAAVPKAVALTSPGANGIPPIQLQFNYDAKGKILLAPGSSVGTESLTGSATLGKLLNGSRSYTVTAKGATLKTLTLTIKGQVGQATATASFKSGTTKLAVPDLPVSLNLVSPVMSSFTLLSQMDVKGKITGSGTIRGGFGNDSTLPGVLTGKSNKTALSWQLKQGTQRLSFSGKQAPQGFVGTLVATLPPANGSYKPFVFPGFSGETAGGGDTTFKGSISLAAQQAGLPSPATDARFSVSSDLNGNGIMEPNERFAVASDRDGKYTLACPVADGGKAILEITSEGYATHHEVLDPARAGAAINRNYTLRPLEELTISGTDASSSDGKLQIIELPPEIATVQARVFNPVTETDQFPGEFADDQNNLLVSSVFSAIDARDSNGDPVTDLGAGSILKMQVPKDTWNTMKDLHSGNGQIDVPLYYFDEQTGQWKRSTSDGWLEDASGAKIAENNLSSIRNGSFPGLVSVAGLITHLSYWNLDWPVDTHGCIRGVIVDAQGNPVAGASVTVRGATYTGSSSPQVTGPDGSFCVDVMRSEAAGEDVDGNGVSGETHQVTISVSHNGSVYSFGAYNIPASQATCANGNCLNLGSIRLDAANKLTVGLCSITGTVVYAADGAPVSGASVFAFDEDLDQDTWFYFITNSSMVFFSTTDANGNFALNVPVLSRVSVFASFSKMPGAHTTETGYAQRDASGCPSAPLLLEAERYRTFKVMDASAEEVGYIWQDGAGNASIFFSIGNQSFWVEPPNGGSLVLPSQPGASATFDLHGYNGMTTETLLGTITFTATTAIGGTWQTTGVSLSGTWGN